MLGMIRPTLCYCVSFVLLAAGGLKGPHYSCFLQDVGDGAKGAGIVTHIRAKCIYDKYRDEFFYLFAWDPPPLLSKNQTSVTGYRVAVYDNPGHMPMCFQVSASQQSLKFNKTVGFRPGKELYYTVTAQPIQRNEDQAFHAKMRSARACPRAPKLEPLQNLIVPSGGNVSFRCDFVQVPFPPAQITWLFSKDKQDCKKLMEIPHSREIPRGILLSQDGLVLEIPAARKEHVGCYVLLVDNGVGGPQQVRGYLDLKAPLPSAKATGWATAGPIFLLLTVLFIVAVLIFASYKCLTLKFTPHDNDRLLAPTI